MSLTWASRCLGRCALALVVLTTATACSRNTRPALPDADDDNVLFIGDSIFALSHAIEQNLYTQAGMTFRSYTASGARLNSGGIAPSVVSQFMSAESFNPNSTVVVMNGGGNDVLLPAVMGDPSRCLTASPTAVLSATCQQLVTQLGVDLTDFLNSMARQGVKNVIYLGYYYTKNGSLGQLANLRQANDFSAMALSQGCSRITTLACTFLDTRALIASGDINADGVHPNAMGSRKLSDLIFPRLRPLL